MQASQISEIKQQAIIEKAQDPESAVSSQAAKEAIVDETRAAGGTAYQFNPDASKEQKAAQLNASIPSEVKDLKAKFKAGPTAVASDADTGPPQYNLPPPTKAGATSAPVGGESDAHGETAEDEKFWNIVGWAPRFGDGTKDVDFSQNLSDQQTWVEQRLDDKFFGDWYFNAGIIIFACLMSWVVAVLGGGLAWVFLVMATCSTYYRTSMRRVRRNARDDVRRELAKARLETDTESLEWINSFLVKFWPIYAPVLCKTIVMSVDQVLSVATPPMVESLKLTTFTLGTKPPRLEHVKTYPRSEDDIVLMDWKFSFNPNDTADMTARQLKVKQNPKVVLEVRIGKGVVSKGLDVIVEDMAFEGLMRVKIKLQLAFPHIDRVEICFLEKPSIDYVCKPLGGDHFGFDINFIPGLESFIQDQIHANLAPMMYDPNVFPIEVAKMLAGSPVDQAIGVVQITFHGAQGLKNPDQFAGTPDPYATVLVNDREVLGRTKTVKENANPKWNEVINIIVSSLTDTLNFHVFDFNDFRKDRELGQAAFSLERFEMEHEFENESLELTLNGKARGVVLADLRFFPVLKETKLEDGTIQPPPETMTGIARFTVEQAKDLDGTKSLIGLYNPYACLILNGKEVHVTEKLKRTNNPIWSNNHKEILITDRRSARLGLVIKDEREIGADPQIGSYQIKLDDLIEMTAKGQEWFNLAGVKSGKAKMKIEWRPVDVKGGALGSGGYVTPIGVMRVYFKNARDLKNVETVGKSDPYVRLLLSGVEKARTVTWKNNLNPDFDEVCYVPVHAVREKLLLEVMDEENMGKDRPLGHIEVDLKDYIHREDSGEYAVNDSKNLISGTLHWGPGKSNKGTLNYSCSFFPCIPTIDPDEEEREKELDGIGTPRISSDSFQSAGTAPKNGDIAPKKSMDSTKPPSTKTASIPSSPIVSRGRSGTQTSTTSALKPVSTIPEVSKIRITADNLLDYGRLIGLPEGYSQSGLLIFQLLDGDLARQNCFLQVLIDDHVFPTYSSNKVKSKHHEFNETGDAMVRELDMSRITLRLIQNVDKEGKGTDEHVIAKLSGQTLQTLQRCLYTPTKLTLRDDHGTESSVNVKLKFIPIKMKLDPCESFRNMGSLRVEVISASELPAADRNGYSDPYCKFRLNDTKVHETEKKKKTLNPTYNENFEVAVRSRTASNFIVEVWDWDFGDSDDLLGKGIINLADIEPYQKRKVDVKLDGKSGFVTISLLFTPDYITRSRQGSSTFHGTFGAAGKVAGAPVKVVGKGVGVVGGGVVKTGSFLGKSFRRRKSRAGNEDGEFVETGSIDGDAPPVPSIEVAETGHQRTPSANTSRLSISGLHNGAAETGSANLQVVSASGFPPGSNVRVHVKVDQGGKGSKEVHKTKAIKSPKGEDVTFESESFKVSCAADTPFRITVKDHSTFGSDDELGEGTFFLSDQGAGSEQVVRMTKGTGSVVVKSSFMQADKASVAGSFAGAGGNRLSRFGIGSKRESRERSMTPGA